MKEVIVIPVLKKLKIGDIVKFDDSDDLYLIRKRKKYNETFEDGEDCTTCALFNEGLHCRSVACTAFENEEKIELAFDKIKKSVARRMEFTGDDADVVQRENG